MQDFPILFAQQKGNVDMGPALAGIGTVLIVVIVVFALIYFALLAFMMATAWKIFVKADKPGWAALIPIYNTIVFLEIVGKPFSWLFLMMIPCVGIYFAIMAMLELAKVFGKGSGFAVGIIVLPFIFLPMLAFGSAKYRKPRPEYDY